MAKKRAGASLTPEEKVLLPQLQLFAETNEEI
jgi:hypothetical protein